MIPADSITIDGDTALLVMPPDHEFPTNQASHQCAICGNPPESHPWPHVEAANRPCDTCDGMGWVYGDEEDPERYECDCDGTGRHTFNLHLSHGPIKTITVHVMSDASAFIVTARGDGHGAIDVEQRITLPPAAEPGMWLVRLAVHS